MSKITYTHNGNHLLLDIILKESPPEAVEPLNKYGRMRRSFLKNHRPILYSQLLLSEQLYQHLHDTQQVANDRMEIMMVQLIEHNPPPDKATDGLAWAAHMSMLHHTAEETVVNELIFE